MTDQPRTRNITNERETFFDLMANRIEELRQDNNTIQVMIVATKQVDDRFVAGGVWGNGGMDSLEIAHSCQRILEQIIRANDDGRTVSEDNITIQ